MAASSQPRTEMLLAPRKTTRTPAGPEHVRIATRPDFAAVPSSVGIVTMTLARTVSEARQLEAALRTLSGLGLPVWAGEGGSMPGFAERIEALSNVQVCPLANGCKPTLVRQVRTAFGKALESDCTWFLYTEPDKRAFFANGLLTLAQASAAPDSAAPGLVLAARTPRGFATFPEGQRIAEGLMNRICGEALGQEGDYTYGPMLIHRRLARDVERIPENLGWGWRFFLMALARQLRMGIVLRKVGRPCPRSQRGEDDARSRDYRLRQLIENMTGLANGWTFLLDPPTLTPSLSGAEPLPQTLP